MTETVPGGGWGEVAHGGLHSIDGIKNCLVEVPASLHGLQQSMLNNVVVVVRLEGDDDVLVHGLGDGGGAGWPED